jgi:signal transduction histidine kinase
VLRIVGEALTNACRHAAAERIVVLHERAELLDAHLDVRSDQTGTTVRLQMALSAA